jgi:hypothetical protein
MQGSNYHYKKAYSWQELTDIYATYLKIKRTAIKKKEQYLLHGQKHKIFFQIILIGIKNRL